MHNTDIHNDPTILERLAAGEEAAFRLLYERHWNRVYSTALAITQSPQLAMDVVQDTFTTLWKKRETLTGVENIEAYIYVTGRNRIISLLRSRRLYEQVDVLNSRPLPETQLSPEQQAALRQFRDNIQQAIKLLPPQQATVFRLSRLEEYSYEEISEKMGISRDTVRNHLVKALSFMRTYFQTRREELLFILLLLSCFF